MAIYLIPSAIKWTNLPSLYTPSGVFFSPRPRHIEVEHVEGSGAYVANTAFWTWRQVCLCITIRYHSCICCPPLGMIVSFNSTSTEPNHLTKGRKKKTNKSKVINTKTSFSVNVWTDETKEKANQQWAMFVVVWQQGEWMKNYAPSMTLKSIW